VHLSQNHLLIFNYPKRHSTDAHNRTNKGVNASADPHMLGSEIQHHSPAVPSSLV
jgi:hypothetical protein